MTPDDLLTGARGSDREAPPGATPLVRALWLEARGDWNAAHQIAQDDDGADAAWVHAYLHRKEGDAGNAAYWYGRAGRPVATGAFDDEWRRIAAELLGRSSRVR
ncbi:MAG TPA: hypothetical protein VE987_19555 [Polyangiaceae bacterium]|nr:hypothetical protein [Polyangiaceae bacterium]